MSYAELNHPYYRGGRIVGGICSASCRAPLTTDVDGFNQRQDFRELLFGGALSDPCGDPVSLISESNTRQVLFALPVGRVTFSNSASGALVSPNEVLTVEHTFSSLYKPGLDNVGFVEGSGCTSQSWMAARVLKDCDIDAALISLSPRVSLGMPGASDARGYMRMRLWAPSPGTALYVFGYPGTAPNPTKRVSVLRVHSAFRHDTDDEDPAPKAQRYPAIIELKSERTCVGQSGGPYVDEDGFVVGIHRGSRSNGFGAARPYWQHDFGVSLSAIAAHASQPLRRTLLGIVEESTPRIREGRLVCLDVQAPLRFVGARSLHEVPHGQHSESGWSVFYAGASRESENVRLLHLGTNRADDLHVYDIPDVRHDDLGKLGAGRAGVASGSPVVAFTQTAGQARGLTDLPARHVVSLDRDDAAGTGRLKHSWCRDGAYGHEWTWQHAEVPGTEGVRVAGGCASFQRGPDPRFRDQSAHLVCHVDRGSGWRYVTFGSDGGPWRVQDFEPDLPQSPGAHVIDIVAWMTKRDGARAVVVRKEGPVTVLYMLRPASRDAVRIHAIYGHHVSFAATAPRDSYGCWRVRGYSPRELDRVGPCPVGVSAALNGDLYIINMTSGRVERMTLNDRNVGVSVPMWTHGHVAAWEPALLGDDFTQFGTRTHFFMNGDAGELGHLWEGGGRWRFQQWGAGSFVGDVREAGQVRLSRSGRIAVATRRDANNRPDAVVFFENGPDQCVWQVTPALGETFASGHVRSPLRARSLTGLSGIPTGWAYTQNTDSCVVSLGQPAPRDGSTELILGLAEARAREPDRRFESRPVGDEVAEA